MAAVDAGIKYAGFAFNSEVFLRWISDFVADGPLPHDDLFNAGFTLQASYIQLPRLLEVYTAVSAVGGELGLGRELAAGLNLRPFGTRNIRFNGEVIYLDRSSAGGLFTPYLPGMTGPVAHASVDLFF